MTEHESAVRDATLIRDYPTRDLIRLGNDGRTIILTNEDGSVFVLVYREGQWQDGLA